MHSETKSSSGYQSSVKKVLSEKEISELADKHWTKLSSLSRLYLPNLDISEGIPVRTEFLDAIRGSWLLDKSTNKPPYEDIISGVGFAFGLFLHEKFDMQWCLIEDNYGEDISMVKFQDRTKKKYNEVSIPPFNYVAKRKDVQNVEVFCDGVLEFEKLINAESNSPIDEARGKKEIE
jgi:hypothetical protein